MPFKKVDLTVQVSISHPPAWARKLPPATEVSLEVKEEDKGGAVFKDITRF